MIRRLLPFLIIAAIAAGGAAYYYYDKRAAQPGHWLGYAEADYVRLAPVQPGRLTALYVARGSIVDAGVKLFEQDSQDDAAAVQQAEADLTGAQEKLADLQGTGREAEIAQAKADLADMRAAHDRSALDLARAETLVRTGSTSRQNVDQLRADTASAAARVQAAEARLALISQATGREHAIAAQQAAIAAAQAVLAQAQWRLDQRRVGAPAAGRIADTFAQPGEMLAAGTAVVSLLPPENIFVRFYVPETALATLRTGQTVRIACDSCPPDLTARISFIATGPEYTPPVIYSTGARGNLVYLVEARPAPAQAALLKPGQPADVFPAAP